MERGSGPINGPGAYLFAIVVKKWFQAADREESLLNGNSPVGAGRVQIVFDEGLDQRDH